MQGVGQFLRVLFQGLIQADIPGYLHDDGVFRAVLRQIRHEPEFVIGVLGRDIVGAAQHEKRVAFRHHALRLVIVIPAALAVQHTQLPPFLHQRKRVLHTLRVLHRGLPVKKIVLPFSAVQRVEKAGVHNIAQVLEAVTGQRDLIQCQTAACGLYLGRQLPQLREGGGQRPPVLVKKRLVVGDAQTGEEGGQQIDRSVVRDLVET